MSSARVRAPAYFRMILNFRQSLTIIIRGYMKVNVVQADGELRIQPVVTIMNVFEKTFMWQMGAK